MNKKRPNPKTSPNNSQPIQINLKNNKYSLKKDSEKIIYLPKEISLKQKQSLPQQKQLPYEKPKTSEASSFIQPSKSIKSERNNILSKVIFLDKNKQHIDMNLNQSIKSKLIEKNNLMEINDNDKRKITENDIYANYISYKTNNINNNNANKEGNSLSLNKNMIYKRKKSKDHCVHKSEKRRYICNTPVVHEKIKTKIGFNSIDEMDNNKMTIQHNEKDNLLINGFSIEEDVYKPKTKSFVVSDTHTNKLNFLIDTPNNSNNNLFIDEKEHLCNEDSQILLTNHNTYTNNINQELNKHINNEQYSTPSMLNNKASSHKKQKREYDFLAPVVQISLDLDKDISIQHKYSHTNKKHSTLESANVITKGVPDLSLLSTNRTDNITNSTIDNHKQSSKYQQLQLNKDEIQNVSSMTITSNHISNSNDSIRNKQFISLLRNSVNHKSAIPEPLYTQTSQQEHITRTSFRNNAKNTSSFINENLNTFNNYRHRVLNDFDNKTNNACNVNPSNLFIDKQNEEYSHIQARKHESDSNLNKIMNRGVHSIDSKLRSQFGSFNDKSYLNGLRNNFDFVEDQNERGNSSSKKYNLIYDYDKIGKELIDDQNDINKIYNPNKKRIYGSNSFVNEQQVKEIKQFELFN